MIKDLTGKSFGKLTVLEISGRQNNAVTWKCRCDCGKEVIVRGNNLTSGRVKSCGEHNAEHAYKHGGTNTRLYNIWYGIIRRIEDIDRRDYPNYGGRGIKMCPEWRNDFSVFREWAIHNGYDDSLTIDRIDNDGDYSPENCRWVSIKTQQGNTRRNVYLTHNGRTMCASEWAAETGLKAKTIRKRKKLGWSDEDTLTLPLKTTA